MRISKLIALLLSLSVVTATQLGCSQTPTQKSSPTTTSSQASVEQLFKQGNAAQEAGKYSQAEAIWRKVLKVKPKDAVAYRKLGIALRKQGKVEQAIAKYEKAIQLNPKYADAYNSLGIALSDQGKLEQAIARRLRKSNPTQPQTS